MASRRAFAVVGLFYGDEGKGSITDWLVRRYEATQVVRFNGGPQAAHKVVTPDGRHHTFSQWSSGIFVSGVKTYLSRYTLINPLNMIAEEVHLREVGVKDAWERLEVDSRAIVITPWHRSVNRLRELARGEGRHGSCGEGVGEAVVESLRGHVICAGDLLLPRGELIAKLRVNQARMLREAESIDGFDEEVERDVDLEFYSLRNADEPEALTEVYARVASRLRITREERLDDVVVMEGAQGVLLDESLRIQPHTTWSRTTFANAVPLAAADGHELVRVGVMRPYLTRHGAGPLANEDDELAQTVAECGEHNGTGPWQGTFRAGWMCRETLTYARSCIGGVDTLAVTCLDHVPVEDHGLRAYVNHFGAARVITSHGPTHEGKDEIKASGLRGAVLL